MIRARMKPSLWTSRRGAKPGAALTVGVVAVSSAAILVSLARAQGVPALWIAALRVSAAAVVVVAVALVRCRAEIRGLSPRDIGLGALSGVFLSLHFGLWTASLDSTSVMSSVVFVSTSPLFVAAASVYRMLQRPFFVGGVGIAYGYLKAALARHPRYGDTAYLRHLRRYELLSLIFGRHRVLETWNRRIRRAGSRTRI